MAYNPLLPPPPLPDYPLESLPGPTRRAMRSPISPALPQPITTPPVMAPEPRIQVSTPLTSIPAAIPPPLAPAPAPLPARVPSALAPPVAAPAQTRPAAPVVPPAAAEAQPEPDYQAIIDEAEKDYQAAQSGDVMAGLRGGWETTKALGKYAGAAAAQALGADETAQAWARSAMENERERERYSRGRPTTLEEIDSAGDVFDWLQYHMGAFLPTIAETVGAALVGGAVGAATGPGAVATAAAGAAGKGSVRKMLADYVRGKVGENARSALVKELGEEAGGALADKIAKGAVLNTAEAAAAKGVRDVANKVVARDIGRALGAFGASYQMGVGDLYGETIDDESGAGGNAGLALVGGLPYAALESLMPIMLLGKVRGGVDASASLKDFAKAIGKEGVRMGGTEAATEAMQETLVMGAGIIDDNKDYGTWGDVAMNLANAAAVGAATGFLLGAPGGARRRVSDPQNPDQLEIYDLVEQSMLQQNMEQGPPPLDAKGRIDIPAVAGDMAQRITAIRAEHGDVVADAAEREWIDILARGKNQIRDLDSKRIAAGQEAWERVGGPGARGTRDRKIRAASDRDLLAAYAFGTYWKQVHRRLPEEQRDSELYDRMDRATETMLSEMIRRRAISRLSREEQERMREFFDMGMTPEEGLAAERFDKEMAERDEMLRRQPIEDYERMNQRIRENRERAEQREREAAMVAAMKQEADIATAEEAQQEQVLREEAEKEQKASEEKEQEAFETYTKAMKRAADQEKKEETRRASEREKEIQKAEKAYVSTLKREADLSAKGEAKMVATARKERERAEKTYTETMEREARKEKKEAESRERKREEEEARIEREYLRALKGPQTQQSKVEVKGAVSQSEAARPYGGVLEPADQIETGEGGQAVPPAERGAGVPEGGREERPPVTEGEEAAAAAEAKQQEPIAEAPKKPRYAKLPGTNRNRSWTSRKGAQNWLSKEQKGGKLEGARIAEVKVGKKKQFRIQLPEKSKREPKAPKGPKINRGSFAPLDTRVDSMLAAIAKLDGISRDSITGEIDAPDLQRKYGINPVFRAKGGDTPDGMAGRLLERGYPVRGQEGTADPNVMFERIREELAGNPVYSENADYDLLVQGREPRYADTREESDAIAEELESLTEAEPDANKEIVQRVADARARAESVLDVDTVDSIESDLFSSRQWGPGEFDNALVEVLDEAADNPGRYEGARARGTGEEAREGEAEPQAKAGEAFGLEGETQADLEARRKAEQTAEQKEKRVAEAEKASQAPFRLTATGNTTAEAEAAGNLNLFDAGDGVKASVATTGRGANPLTKDFLQAWIRAFTRKWRGLAGVRVVQSYAELPQLAREKIQAFKDAGIEDPVIRGFAMPDGTIFLIADNLYSVPDALKTFLHEAVGHRGVQGVFGDFLNAVMDQIIKEFPLRVRQIAQERRLDFNNLDERREAAEELLAIMAETHEAPHILKRAYIAIRKFLRAHGINLHLTDADLDGILMAARRYVEEGPEAYRRHRRWPVLGEPLPGLTGPWEPAGGVAESPEVYQAARRIPEIPRTQEFQAWIRDSEVTDENDLPMVVYHGTPEEFTVFRPKEEGGPMFFAPDRAVAEEFARRKALRGDDAPQPHVMPVYLSAQKVWDFRKPEHIALALDWARAKADKNKLGMWSSMPQLVRAVALGNFDAIEDPDFQRDVIKGNNFDAFTVTETPGGPVNYAVYEPTQIKSATHNIGTYSPTNPDIRFSLHRQVKDALLGRRQRGKVNSPFHEQNERIRENDRKTWDLVKRYLRRQLFAGGLLSTERLRPVFQRMLQRDFQFGVQEMEINNLVTHLEDAVKQYGVRKGEGGKRWSKLTDEEMEDLNQALRSDTLDKMPSTMPEETKKQVLALRQYIDKDSAEYRGILQDQEDQLRREDDEEGADSRARLIEIIRTNEGEYVNRSFKVFTDPKYYKTIPDKVLDEARKYIRKERMDRADKLDGWATKARDRANDAEDPQAELDKARTHEERAAELRDPDRVDAMVNAIIKAGTAYSDLESFAREAFISEPKLGAKDLSILIKRKDIAEPILALLGEHKDPRVNFANTATKMGRLIQNQRFLDKVKEIGEGVFLFDRQEDAFGVTVQIGTGDRYSPIDGMWTFPEVEVAFRDALKREDMPNWYRFIVQVNGAIKFGKTVISPTTQLRNWMSAMLFTMANGHFDLSHTGTAVKAMGEHIHATDKGKFFAYLKHLKEIGVVYDTPYAGEMFRLLDETRIQDMFAGNAQMTFKKATGIAQRFYQFGDDFWKITGFENEKALLMKHKKLSEQEAEIQAAERIRNTYPTYSMTGRFINQLRRFPLMGAFVSFPAEIIRTTYHLFRYLEQDMRDPDLRPLAMRRIAGLAIAGGAIHALQAAFTTMLGVDEEEEESIRDMAAPWQTNSNILPIGRDDRGQLRYIDMSFMDPYNYWKRPLNAILRDEPWQEKVKEVAREVWTPFFGPDIAAGAIFEAMTNEKDTGGTVFNPYDTVPNQLSDILGHIAKEVQPGVTALGSRFWAAMDGKIGPTGKVYSKFDETAAAFGFRVTTHDPRAALYYKAFEFRDGKRNATKILTDVARNPNKVSERELRSAYVRAMNARHKSYREMGRIVLAGRLSGLTNQQLHAVLRGSGISQEDTFYLMQLRMPPWRPSKTFMKTAVKKAQILFGEEQARAIDERREFIQRMQ